VTGAGRGEGRGRPSGGHWTSLLGLPYLFRVRSFAGASGLMFLSGLSMYGALFLLPLYYQQARGLSVLAAGLLMAPQGIGSLLPRTWAGKLTDSLGPRPVVLAGMLTAAAATIPFALAGAHTSYVLLCLVLVVRGPGCRQRTSRSWPVRSPGCRKPQCPTPAPQRGSPSRSAGRSARPCWP